VKKKFERAEVENSEGGVRNWHIKQKSNWVAGKETWVGGGEGEEAESGTTRAAPVHLHAMVVTKKKGGGEH